MLFALVASTVTLLLHHLAQASPTPVHSNDTLISNSTDITPASIFPATLMLCNGPDCDSITDLCVGIDLNAEFTSFGVCFESPVFLHSRNLAVISLAAWLVSCTLISGINAVVWAGNVHNHAPVWCDISTSRSRDAARCTSLC